MRYLMLVCWDAEKMDAQTEPKSTDTQEPESFPWLDDLQARGIWVTGDQLAPPRREPLRPRPRREGDRHRRPVRRAQGGRRRVRPRRVRQLGRGVEIAAGRPRASAGTMRSGRSGELTVSNPVVSAHERRAHPPYRGVHAHSPGRVGCRARLPRRRQEARNRSRSRGVRVVGRGQPEERLPIRHLHGVREPTRIRRLQRASRTLPFRPGALGSRGERVPRGSDYAAL